jgi:hypothetical protein
VDHWQRRHGNQLPSWDNTVHRLWKGKSWRLSREVIHNPLSTVEPVTPVENCCTRGWLLVEKAKGMAMPNAPEVPVRVNARPSIWAHGGSSEAEGYHRRSLMAGRKW